MKKSNILACSLLIAGCLNFAPNAFAETPDTMTFVRFGEKQTLTLKKIDNDGNKRYEIQNNGCCIKFCFENVHDCPPLHLLL